MTVKRGTVALVVLDPTQGHEQQGIRPCVIVSAPEATLNQKYPMVCVVPLTSTPGEGALYPALQAGPGSGLRTRSYALVDQLRSLDKQRVRKFYGTISHNDLQALEKGIRLYLGLS